MIRKIYIARKHLMYYLDNLGYDVSKYSSFNISEISAMEKNSSNTESNLDFKVYRNGEDGAVHTCTVMFRIKINLKQNNLQSTASEYYENVKEMENSNLIIVTPNAMNDTIQKTVKMLWKKYKEYVVIMDLPSLQFNILKHSFVPRHIKLSEEEKQQVYQKYNISGDDQLPEISMHDPVAKTIMLRPGEVCKIIRFDKISLENEFFRICSV